MTEIITRIPPSPTGHLHIGTARTALFNFLFARRHGGQMIFRSEDTDKERSRPEFEAEIIEGLRWLGLTWDNDVIYRQSERTTIYRKYLEQIIESDAAYLSREPSKQNPSEEVEVVRLRNPNKVINFTDLVRGEISFDTTELGDLVIARSLDDALYHFTVVVDDFEMGITHVLRGEDHISNTPRQILIQEAIGTPRPAYAHLPLILAPDRSKMSKRHGAVALKEYIAQGFLRDALVNYLALLGWNPGTDQEIFTLEELVEQFDITKLQKSGAIFNRDKLVWINAQHLTKTPDEQFTNEVIARLPERIKTASCFTERLPRLLPTIRERTALYEEVTVAATAGEYDWAFLSPQYETTLLQWKKDPDLATAKPRLEHVAELLQTTPFDSPESLKAAIWPYAEVEGKGEVLWPLRVSLTGKEQSPNPFTCLYVLGRAESLSRIRTACDKIA